jgi:hypothetical protein
VKAAGAAGWQYPLNYKTTLDYLNILEIFDSRMSDPPLALPSPPLSHCQIPLLPPFLTLSLHQLRLPQPSLDPPFPSSFSLPNSPSASFPHPHPPLAYTKCLKRCKNGTCEVPATHVNNPEVAPSAVCFCDRAYDGEWCELLGMFFPPLPSSSLLFPPLPSSLLSSPLPSSLLPLPSSLFPLSSPLFPLPSSLRCLLL